MEMPKQNRNGKHEAACFTKKEASNKEAHGNNTDQVEEVRVLACQHKAGHEGNRGTKHTRPRKADKMEKEPGVP